MKKHVWKISTGVLLIVCLVLAFSVYDAERRVDLFFERYKTVDQQLEQANYELKQAKKEIESISEIPEGLTRISFDGGIGISYFVFMDKVIVVCDFNGDNVGREFAIAICALITACENYNTRDAIAIDSAGNNVMSSEDGNIRYYGKYRQYKDVYESLFDKYRTDLIEIWR